MELMIALAFVIGYPVFMIFSYGLAKLIFTPLDKLAQEQQKERVFLMIKAKRVKKMRRLVHAQ